MTQLVRVHNFNISSDGYGAGINQSLDRPFGDADPSALFAWSGATAHGPTRTEPGGSRGFDDYCTREWHRNIGAEIMGRNKFGPQRGPWENYDWQGWWGDEPVFHTPVFVLTHHVRPSITLGRPLSTSSTPPRRKRWRGHSKPPTARMCASAAAPSRSVNSSTPISSTPCTSPSPRSNSARVSDSGRRPRS